MRIVTTAICSFFAASAVLAQGTPLPPTVPGDKAPSSVVLPPKPPSVGIAKAGTDQNSKVFVKITVTEPVVEKVPFNYTVQVPTTVQEDDGKGGKRTDTKFKAEAKTGVRSVTKAVFVEKVFLAGGDSASFADASGKSLSDDELLKRLQEPSPIFIFDGKADELFLKAIKPEAIVMTLKATVPLAPVSPAVPAVAPPLPPVEKK